MKVQGGFLAAGVGRAQFKSAGGDGLSHAGAQRLELAPVAAGGVEADACEERSDGRYRGECGDADCFPEDVGAVQGEPELDAVDPVEFFEGGQDDGVDAGAADGEGDGDPADGDEAFAGFGGGAQKLVDQRTVALSDDEDTQLEGRSRVSNKYLTGLFAAAVIIIVTGAVVAVEPRTHYFWGEVAVAILSILVLVFRGRSLPDRVHAVTFFIGAFVLLVGFTLTIITGTSNVVAEISVLGGVVAVAILAALGAMLLPGKKMSPITLRRIEYLEFAANMAVAMLAFWIVGAFLFFRNLL